MVRFSMDIFVKTHQPEKYEAWLTQQNIDKKPDVKPAKSDKGQREIRRGKNGEFLMGCVELPVKLVNNDWYILFVDKPDYHY